MLYVLCLFCLILCWLYNWHLCCWTWTLINISWIDCLLYICRSSSIGTTAHCGLWPVEQYPSIFSYLPPTLSIFSLPALEDLFLFPLSIFSCVFPFFSSLPVLEWRSFWASYPPPFSLGDLTSLSFALLSIWLYFHICSFLLVLDSTYDVMNRNSAETRHRINYILVGIFTNFMPN